MGIRVTKKYITPWTIIASITMILGLAFPFHNGEWGNWFVGAFLYYSGLTFIIVSVLRAQNA